MKSLSEKIITALEAKSPLKGPDRNGNYQTLCPFHEETRPSFSFHPEKGYKCFACNAKGGPRALAEHLGLEAGPLTIEQLAEAKGIPAQWLIDHKLAKQGKGGVEIPYRNEEGEEAALRIRLNLCKLKSDNRFIWEKGKPVMPYGLWLLREQRVLGKVIIVEGESDCWTLWYNGFPSIGIPGARNWKKSWAKHFNGFSKIYVWVEPDEAGRGFLSDLVTDMPDILVLQGPGGIKDPSDLYMADPQAFKEALSQAMEDAKPAIEALKEMASIYDMNWQGRCGRWHWDNDGIHIHDRRGQDYIALQLKVRPLEILITPEQRRFCHLTVQTGGQVCDVYLADSWVGLRGSEAAKELADYGVALTTKQVAILQEFIGELLNEALLPSKAAYRNLGWYDDYLFLPGQNNAVYLPSPGLDWFKYYGKIGSAETARAIDAWQYIITEGRKAAPSLLVAVGAALASPFLQTLPGTEFISFLVHLHTLGTGTGKTTILELAASTIGDPRRICSSWDSTKVGLEQMLGPARHWPLFLNELGDAKFGVPEDAVMMITEEVGRRRGASGGGLRPTTAWRTIVLSTGNSQLAIGSAHHARRVLSVPIALESEDLAHDCQEIAHEFYGYPVQWCMNLYQTKVLSPLRDIADCYAQFYRRELQPLKPQAYCWALVEIGARMLCAALGIPEGDIHDSMLSVASQSAARRRIENIDYVTHVIQLIQEDIVRDSGAYGCSWNKQRAIRGIAGRILDEETREDPKLIAILPTRLNELCKNNRIPDLPGALMEARSKGILETGQDKQRLTKKVRIGDSPVWAYVFNMEEAEKRESQLGGNKVGTEVGTKNEANSCICSHQLSVFPPVPS